MKKYYGVYNIDDSIIYGIGESVLKALEDGNAYEGFTFERNKWDYIEITKKLYDQLALCEKDEPWEVNSHGLGDLKSVK
jgi:hypothetical protein